MLTAKQKRAMSSRDWQERKRRVGECIQCGAYHGLVNRRTGQYYARCVPHRIAERLQKQERRRASHGSPSGGPLADQGAAPQVTQAKGHAPGERTRDSGGL